MATNVLTLSAGGVKTEMSVASALGYTPINKAGDTGIGALSMGALTATSSAADFTTRFVNNNGTVNGHGLLVTTRWNVTGNIVFRAETNNGTNPMFTVYGDATSTFHGGSVTMGSLTTTNGMFSNFVALTNATNPYYKLDNGTYQGYLEIASNNIRLYYNGASALSFDTARSATFSSSIQSTTHKVTSAGGYISSDGSTGYTGTVTTASLVGKTLTIKDGIITGFA